MTSPRTTDLRHRRRQPRAVTTAAAALAMIAFATLSAPIADASAGSAPLASRHDNTSSARPPLIMLIDGATCAADMSAGCRPTPEPGRTTAHCPTVVTDAARELRRNGTNAHLARILAEIAVRDCRQVPWVDPGRR